PPPVVRLYLASGLQRLPREKRWGILEELVKHAEDASDHNLPLMYWYAAEPLADVDAARALQLAAKSKVPLLSFMVRRIGSKATPEAIALLVNFLGRGDDDDTVTQRIVLNALLDALKGRRRVEMPADWSDSFDQLLNSKDAEVRTAAL